MRLLISMFLCFVSAGAYSQTGSGSTDFAGEWRGETAGKVELHLTVSPDGRYALYWLTGPGAGSIPKGNVTIAGSSLVLKYRDGEMKLAKTPQGILSGTYFTGLSKGAVTFSSTLVGPPATMAAPPTRAEWRAALTLVSGIPRNCGDGPYSNYSVKIVGLTFLANPENGESQFVRKVSLNLSALKSDGSGRVSTPGTRGAIWHFDFDAGSGARKIHARSDSAECTYLWQPF